MHHGQRHFLLLGAGGRVGGFASSASSEVI